MSKAIFITATDTDAGKTWITSQLVNALLKQRTKCKALKPIACGFNADGKNDDIQSLLAIQDLPHTTDINCYSFAKPAAPSIAAQAEEKNIEPKHLQAWCSEQRKQNELCLIEAIGGLMVPITANYLVSDWLLAMPDMPVVLVVGAKLGCINHALLSMAHLSQIGREPAWIIINNCDGKQNTSSIKKALLPYMSDDSTMLECGYHQPENLSPLITYLQTFLTKKII